MSGARSKGVESGAIGAHRPNRVGIRRRWILWRQGFVYTVHGPRNPEPPNGVPYRHRGSAELVARVRTRLTHDHHWVYRFGRR